MQVAYRAAERKYDKQETFACWISHILPLGARVPEIRWDTGDDIDSSIAIYLLENPVWSK